MNFEQAFAVLIGHEGGYVDHPRDPGGRTKFGISQRAYPDEDIRHLTLERAQFLYRRDYWDALQLDTFPAVLRLDVFDVAVNMGLKRAIRLLQQALRVVADGVLGPKTLAALLAADPAQVRLLFLAFRLLFYTDLATFTTFGKGWVRRVANNVLVGS